MPPLLAVLAPGQGAQAAGMLAPWLEIPAAAAVVATFSRAAGLDLETLGTTGGADEIRPTGIAQPLVVAASLASAACLGDPLSGVSATAGHSVGEWAAAVLAGALDLQTAASLVAARGRAMAAASAGRDTGMAAVLGGDETTVLAGIEAAGLWAANVNGAGQIVAAGDRAALDAFLAEPPAGARVRPLDVAAAFHTPVMAPAVAALAAAAADATTAAPRISFVGNAAGAILRTGPELLDGLVAQVARPVRFDLVLGALRELGVTAVLELAPAGVLTALVKRELPGVATFAVKSPENLDAAAGFIAEHAGDPVGAGA